MNLSRGAPGKFGLRALQLSARQLELDLRIRLIDLELVL
jgi:hypothetical protein